MIRLNFKTTLDICFFAKLYSTCVNSRNKKNKFFSKKIEKAVIVTVMLTIIIPFYWYMHIP